MKSLHNRLAGSQPFVLVGVSVGTEKEKLEEFLAANGIEWPQTVDERGEVSELFGVQSYPTHLLIDPEGRIVYRHRGWGRTSPKELQTEVGRALRNAAREKKTGSSESWHRPIGPSSPAATTRPVAALQTLASADVPASVLAADPPGRTCHLRCATDKKITCTSRSGDCQYFAGGLNDVIVCDGNPTTCPLPAP